MVGRRYLAIVSLSCVVLASCDDSNKYQPPPPAEVGVQKPQQRRVTLHLELTGNTSAFNKVDLVARVQGFLEKVGYKDGDRVTAGTTLFEIERAPYETSLQIAEATQRQQEALLVEQLAGRLGPSSEPLPYLIWIALPPPPSNLAADLCLLSKRLLSA